MPILSALGLGSNVLTADVIDQLRDAETASIINPIDRNIVTNTSKTTNLNLLITELSSFKSNTRLLGDESNYLKRSATSTGESISISAVDGSDIQNFNIDVISLAKTEIKESTGFENKTDSLISSSETLNIFVDDTSFSLEIDNATSLADLRDLINNQIGDKVTASILDTGEDRPFKLIIKSNATGDENSILFGNTIKSEPVTSGDLSIAPGEFTINGTDISFATPTTNTSKANVKAIVEAINTASIANISASMSKDGTEVILNDSTGADITITGAKATDAGFSIATTNGSGETILSALGLNTIQEAADSHITYNSIDVYRSSNSIDNLVNGVSISLETTGSSDISITQDSDSIKTNLSDFIDTYNGLVNTLNDLTKYDSDTKSASIFQGNTFITGILTDINQTLFSTTNSGVSLVDYGISLNREGVASLDNEVFDKKLKDSPDTLQEFFSGKTTYETTSVVGNDISAGSLNIGATDFSINGVAIELTTNVANSVNENAIALKNVINQSSIAGVTAELSDDGLSIVLLGASATDITITGDDPSLAFFTTSNTIGQSERTDGLFTNMITFLDNLFVTSNSSLKLFSDQLDKESTSLENTKITAQTRLDSRYATLTKQFAQYDQIISNLNANFQALQTQIDALANKN